MLCGVQWLPVTGNSLSVTHGGVATGTNSHGGPSDCHWVIATSSQPACPDPLSKHLSPDIRYGVVTGLETATLTNLSYSTTHCFYPRQIGYLNTYGMDSFRI